MIYLDYAATNPNVKFSYNAPFMNPNANYAYREKRLLHDCEERIKVSIGAKSGKVLFGGTSSQLVENLMARAKEVSNYFTVYSSVYEHSSFDRWTGGSFKDIETLEALLKISCPYNCYSPIVFHQAVQNITGQIFDVKRIGKLCHKYGAFYICDVTALWGHTALPDGIDDWCDAIFQSSHKIGTEIGIGFCWLSDKFNDWLNNMTLHGTPNVAGALAICDATEYAIKDVVDKETEASDLYCYLMNQLDSHEIKYMDVNEYVCEFGKYTPFINAIRLIGINADALQQYLANKDIYVGVGRSSCAANEDFRQLCKGYNLTPEEAREVVRISFGENTTYDDIDNLVSAICEFRGMYV